MGEPIFLDADGVPLVAGGGAHVKRGSVWVRVWVRSVQVSAYGKKLPYVLIDNGERWDVDGAGRTWTYMDAWDDPKKIRRAAGPTAARDLAAEQRDALRQIATAIGTPAHVDPLADLPGLVMMVQAVVQRAESSAIVVADAVAAERMAIGAWLRTSVRSAPLARNVEHGDHINDDAPPLPSLRMVMLARDELHRQIKALEEERDRRIDPVEHAKAAMDGWSGWWVVNNGMPNNAQTVHRAWLESPERVTLLDRVGPDVLAEVER